MGAKDKAGGKRKQDKKEEKSNAEPEQKRNKKEEQEPEPADESEDEFEILGEDEDEDDSDSEPGEPIAAELFEEKIKKREEEMGKHCMVVGTLDIPSDDEEDEGEDSDSEDGKGPTMEQLQQLARVWVPKEVDIYFNALAEELQKIGCTDDEDSDDDEDMETLEGEKLTPEQKAAAKKAMQEAGWVMRMLSTRHSYPMHKLLNDSLAKVDKALKANKWEEAFCHWAATVQAARRETHWFSDTDVPAEVEKIYEKLRTQWSKLEKHSDEELGGLIVEGDAKSTKEAFSNFLQCLADEMGEFEYKVKDVVKKSKE